MSLARVNPTSYMYGPAILELSKCMLYVYMLMDLLGLLHL